MTRFLTFAALLAATPALGATQLFYVDNNSGTTADGIYTSATAAAVAKPNATTVLTPLPQTASNTSDPSDIESYRSTLYYTDFTTDKIYKLPTTGGSATTLVDLSATAATTINNIALNGTGTTLYYGDSNTKGLFTVPTTGGTSTKIVDYTAIPNYSTNGTGVLPRGIAVNDATNKVYFSDSTGDQIYIANADGSGTNANAAVLLNLRTAESVSNSSITSLAIGGSRLFWTDNAASAVKIFSSALDGSDVQTFLVATTDLGNVTHTLQDIEYDNGALYFTDSSTTSLYSAPTSFVTGSGTGVATLVTGYAFRGLAVPEPTTAAVLGFGSLVVAARRRRSR